jgi:long-chain acyl-CoA synthetase
MYLGTQAELFPDREAVVIGQARYTYGALERRSNQGAHAWRELGLAPGDGILMMLENRIEFFEIWWGAMRSGLYVTPVNWHLTPGEVSYLIRDSGARALIYSTALVSVVEPLIAEFPALLTVAVGERAEDAGRVAYETLVAAQPDTPIASERAGATMFYSSGTTGRPKGIRPPLSGGPPDDGSSASNLTVGNFGLEGGHRFLSTGPLYHAAPALWTTGMHTVGSTVVVMERFDAAAALQLLTAEDITISQWVPTMFRRLLQLPAEVRESFAAPLHQRAWHAAAPCPRPVKEQMLDWWGPVIWEYYSGSEGGGTVISPQEWLARPGSVGKHWRGGTTHVLDADTKGPVSPGTEGLIFFEAFATYRFRYHNDPEKTASTYHGDLITLGDIGYLDDDGYLFLTDRRSDMIVSGGVNIYPREVEETLLSHPGVQDAAVFGIPDAEFGERVLACVQPADPQADHRELEQSLDKHCRAQLAGFKRPRAYRFEATLPRDANGKLYKRRLRDEYWSSRPSRLI